MLSVSGSPPLHSVCEGLLLPIWQCCKLFLSAQINGPLGLSISPLHTHTYTHAQTANYCHTHTHIDYSINNQLGFSLSSLVSEACLFPTLLIFRLTARYQKVFAFLKQMKMEFYLFVPCRWCETEYKTRVFNVCTANLKKCAKHAKEGGFNTQSVLSLITFIVVSSSRW